MHKNPDKECPMDNWRYQITVHETDDILTALQEPVGDAPPAIYCDDEGICYFDEGPNPFTQAIEQILNQHGAEGWELAQVNFRSGQMICFWKQPR
jgi:hypothetical protein